jgi:hypothetical protein
MTTYPAPSARTRAEHDPATVTADPIIALGVKTDGVSR